MMSPRQTGTEKSGFTLLEVLIALALSVIVIGAIAVAIRLHLVTLNRQQERIESQQVARSVIMMITNDVRAAIQYRAQDFSALENLILSEQMIAGIGLAMQDDANPDNDDAGMDAAGAGLGGGDVGEVGGGQGAGDAGGQGADDAGGQGAGGAGGQGASGAGTDRSAAESEAADMEECVACRPTFIGTATAISVDASRLPRVDQYNPLIAVQSNLVQTPSDVKSIAYFVDEAAPENQENQFESRTENAPGGLYRRQIDRAVAAFREETGTVQVDQYSQLVAPEVAQIGMRYFDGEEWVEQWDSEENGGFPPAVEIVLILDPARSRDGNNYQYAGFDPDTMQSYRAVIHLPTAELEESE